MTTRAPSGQLGMATPFHELLGLSDAELQAEFADYERLGVEWVRTDLYWDNIQRSVGGSFDWTLVDKVVNAAAAHGIKVIGLLNGAPAWGGANITSAADQAEFGRFAGAAATHFAGRIDHWEILNEPNMGVMTPETYTKVLKAAYAAIKAVDPTDTVIVAGNASVPYSTGNLIGAVEFLERMYAAGARGHFDAMGFHPYTYPLLPTNPAGWNGWNIMEDGIRASMVAHGDGDKQIWITELGAPTDGGVQAMSQADQALVLTQAVQIASESGWAGPILWYSYQDRGNTRSNTEDWFGLVGPNGERKEAYDAFQALASRDDAPPPAGGPPVLQPPASDLIIMGDERGNVLHGGVEDESLLGGRGDDVLAGGGGNDRLWGGEGADRFVFERDGGWDRIMDLGGGDRIDLGRIDADATEAGHQAFRFVGSAWLAAAGDLGVYQDAAQDATFVQGDTNGDGAYDFSVRLEGVHALSMDDLILALPPPPDEAANFRGTRFVGSKRGDTAVGGTKGEKIDGRDGNDTLRGQGGNDVVWGGKGHDALWGGAGHDVLSGGTGNDRLHGGEGNDLVWGGKGHDVLHGGAGADTFRFADTASVDTILDFEAGDRIDLGLIDANTRARGNQAFRLVDSAQPTRAGDLSVVQDAQTGVTLVQADRNGDGAYDFRVVLSGLHMLTASDFVL